MTTRAQLITDVDAWMARDNIGAGANIDSLLRVAEANIARRVRVFVQEASTTLTFTGRTAALPANYLGLRGQPKLVNATDPASSGLEYMAPEVLRLDAAYQVGPRTAFYSLEGDGDNYLMSIAPAASVTTSVDILIQYVARFAALANGGDTNWLLTNHYDAYLFALLEAAAVYDQDEALELKYAGRFTQVVEDMVPQENRKRFPMGNLSARGGPRVAV